MKRSILSSTFGALILSLALPLSTLAEQPSVNQYPQTIGSSYKTQGYGYGYGYDDPYWEEDFYPQYWKHRYHYWKWPRHRYHHYWRPWQHRQYQWDWYGGW